MSRSKIILPLILLLALLFALVTQSIVSVTLLELRVQIAAERILNFELSSRMLKTRFRQMLSGEENVKSEIKVNVLESSVLNFEKFELEGTDTILNRIGIFVVNAVRRLNFKQPIRLQEDREFMKQLQVAFYLERNRRYDAARVKYEALIESQDAAGDTAAFLKLHSGYCGALTDQVEPSIVRLKEVITEYPGTHYAEAAQIILDLLEERKRRADKLAGQNLSDRDMARALFNAGDYAGAIRKFRELEGLDLDEQYMLSRSLEETGQIQDAITGYKTVVTNGGESDPSVKSNRRLMLIGNFYNGGKEVRQFSEDNAARLKDTETLANVQEGKELQLRPVIVERLLQSNEKGDTELLGEIKKDLSAAIEEHVAPQPAEEPKKEEPVEKPAPRPPVKFSLRLKDGRQVKGTRVVFSPEAIMVYRNDVEILVPPGNLEAIVSPGGTFGVTLDGVGAVESSSCTIVEDDVNCTVLGSEKSYELKTLREVIAR